MQEIKTINEFKEIVSENNVIIMFTANWCPDCIVIKPFLPELMEKYTNYQFYSVNRDDLMDLCIELDIFGIPSFLGFKEGIEKGRLVNKERKTKEEIEAFIESLN